MIDELAEIIFQSFLWEAIVSGCSIGRDLVWFYLDPFFTKLDSELIQVKAQANSSPPLLQGMATGNHL